VAPTETKTVKWWINSNPPGATVYIDDKPYPKPTPVAIEMPRGDEPVSVRVEKEGYEPSSLRMIPLGDENLPLVNLAPTPSESPEADEGPKPTMPRFTARTKPKSGKPAKGGDAKQGSTDAAEPPPSKPPKSDEPELGDVPDFDLVRKKKSQ
jgi:hypothetical protein